MSTRTEHACALMAGFAQRTGLAVPGPSQRYLWTDAFAVCNLLGLNRATGASRHTALALRLVDQVHHVLGRHRPDDRRTGWISGLAEERGEVHPTVGGLRIGKPMAERPPGEGIDERLEWERDGQYFHYLTKWMHALDQVTRSTGRRRFNAWARELAHTAHHAFTSAPRPDGAKRMYWKLSIDLSRPLVASMGQHDPLDGLVTCAQLETTADGSGPRLDDAIADFAAMVDPRGLVTTDPLGIGGLLVDAYRLAQLEQQGANAFGLVAPLLEAGLVGLRHYRKLPDLGLSAPRRLAFRELGLAIGLATLERNDWPVLAPAVRDVVDRLSEYASLRTQIEAFWLEPDHRRAESWLAHANINDVMLATSLLPEGYLVLRPAPPSPP